VITLISGPGATLADTGGLDLARGVVLQGYNLGPSLEAYTVVSVLDRPGCAVNSDGCAAFWRQLLQLTQPAS